MIEELSLKFVCLQALCSCRRLNFLFIKNPCVPYFHGRTQVATLTL